NVVNTTIYALILGLALYWCYVLLRKLEIEVDWRFMLVLSPYIALGSSLRALEDAELFPEGVAYLFIAPQIYLVITLLVVTGLLFTWLFTKRLPMPAFKGDKGTVFIAMELVVAGLITAWFMGGLSTLTVYSLAALVFGLFISFCVSCLSVFRDQEGRMGYLAVTAANGTFLLLMSGMYILLWLQDPWVAGVNTHPSEIWLIPVTAFLLTMSMIVSLHVLSSRSKIVSIFALPSSALIMFGHTFDATATYRGLAVYGYAEKHVLARNVISLANSPIAMFFMKFAVVVAIIYFLEIHIKKEMEDDTMMGVLRLAVFVLGFAPGLRDMLRIAMGI
ncbi:MAG: DUF63 family protein, partial [Thermoplasmata archaeon]|nr:DUF63 family protein [Thermoplasmata archaeon]